MSEVRVPTVADSLKVISVGWRRCIIDATDQFWKAPQIATSAQCTTRVSVGVNVEHGIIRIDLFVDVVGQHEGKNLGSKGAFTVAVDFNIIAMERYMKGDTLEPGLGSTVIGIAYSTARGMILERTNGTMLGGVILPVINPSKLFSEPIRAAKSSAKGK